MYIWTHLLKRKVRRQMEFEYVHCGPSTKRNSNCQMLAPNSNLFDWGSFCAKRHKQQNIYIFEKKEKRNHTWWSIKWLLDCKPAATIVIDKLDRQELCSVRTGGTFSLVTTVGISRQSRVKKGWQKLKKSNIERKETSSKQGSTQRHSYFSQGFHSPTGGLLCLQIDKP